MSFSQKLLNWFDENGRKDLPWQQNISPYRVWVSEIMLQQTQVTTVIAYYQRFMERFPNITQLANAPQDEVFRLWAGLGYYARAKNLHKTAHIIQSQHQGHFPSDYETLVSLPGIGPSTAGAILAISMQQRYPILDGNVKRVLCRHFAIDGWPGDLKVNKKLWQLSDKCTPSDRVHHYTQAIMDLGATLCVRSKPKCHLCPIATTCQAKKSNKINIYPNTRPKTEKPIKSALFLLLIDREKKKILLEKRALQGIWGGLWSLPECALKTSLSKWCQKNWQLKIRKIKKQVMFRHTFTHYHLDIHPRFCEVEPLKKLSKNVEMGNFHWHSLLSIHRLGVPAPVKRLLLAFNWV